jgi:hypothetical protein
MKTHKETKRTRKRNKVIMIVETELEYDWTPARELLNMINRHMPKFQEITISAIGQLIRVLIIKGIIEKQTTKLLGRTEVQYRKIPQETE